MSESVMMGTSLMPGTAYVVASNASAAVILQARILKARYGDLIGICDGVADNVEIQAAIIAVSAVGGGKVRLTEGIFNIATQITTWDWSNITIEGSGWGTVLRMANGANLDPMIKFWWPNGHLKNLKLDGNKANQGANGRLVGIDSIADDTFISVENCLFFNSYEEGIRTENSNVNSRFVIRNNTFIDGRGAAIYESSTGAIIEGNRIIDCATVNSGAITLNAATRATIANNVIEGGSVLAAGQIYITNSTYCAILGNVLKGSVGAGIVSSASNQLTITGNNVVDPATGGILTSNGFGITISGNSVRGSLTGGIYQAANDYSIISNNVIEDCYDNGIDVGGSIGVTIVGNTIRGIKKAIEGLGICLNQSSGVAADNIIEYCALNGILVGGENSNLRVVNNIVKNTRQDTIGGYPVEAGIAVHGFGNLACTGNLIEGNRVYDNQAGTSLLTGTANAGQKVVAVVAGTQFKVYQAVTISDDTPDTEDNIIQSISGNTLTMRTNLAHEYTVAQNAVVNGRRTQNYGVGIRNDGGTTVVQAQVFNNDLDNNLVGPVLLTLSGGTTDARMNGNRGYISPAEERVASGSLIPTGTCTATTVTGVFTESPMALKPGINTLHCTTSGTISVVMPAGSTAVAETEGGGATVTDSPKTCPASATTVVTVTSGGTNHFTITVHPLVFAWHNPETQDIFIRKVVVNITVKGGTATSELEVGIADDGTVATNRGTEFFDALDADAAAILHDSWLPGGVDFGTQTKWVACQDSVSGTDGWVVGELKTEIANALAGSWYIEYVGK